MEYYSAIKKNEILPFATTWVDLEGIMLGEISQTEKDKYSLFSLICNIKIKQTNEHSKTETNIENKLVFTSGRGEGGGAR